MTDIDEMHLQGWIGRTEQAEDVIAPRLVREFLATLDKSDDLPVPGAPAPLAIHWCLSPPTVKASSIGPDGHPLRGGFLPPVPLPRRMWAGGGLQFHDQLRVGDVVRRHSSIKGVTVKEGRSGILCFVTVQHELSTARGLALTERHDIVYRDLGGKAAPKPSPAVLPKAEWMRDMKADPPLLFRYSAVTFNGHRIHYDRNYVTGVEGYPGLIVHGPLQATLLLHFAEEINGHAPSRFEFRGLQPLFDFEPFRLCARRGAEGLLLWVETPDGKQTMDAKAS
jgi:3-methylfumaryl-CoA hydratase